MERGFDNYFQCCSSQVHSDYLDTWCVLAEEKLMLMTCTTGWTGGSKGINSPTPPSSTPNCLLTESLGHKPQVQATDLILSRLDLSPLVHGPAVVWNDLHRKSYTLFRVKFRAGRLMRRPKTPCQSLGINWIWTLYPYLMGWCWTWLEECKLQGHALSRCSWNCLFFFHSSQF